MVSQKRRRKEGKTEEKRLFPHLFGKSIINEEKRGKKRKPKNTKEYTINTFTNNFPKKKREKKKSHLASREAVGGAVKDQRHYRHTLSRFLCFLFIFKNK